MILTTRKEKGQGTSRLRGSPQTPARRCASSPQHQTVTFCGEFTRRERSPVPFLFHRSITTRITWGLVLITLGSLYYGQGALAAGSVYHVVAAVKKGDAVHREGKIVRVPVMETVQTVRWDDIPTVAWRVGAFAGPNGEGTLNLVIEDQIYPPLPVSLKLEPKGELVVSKKRAFLYTVKLGGELSEVATADGFASGPMKEKGVRAVKVSGEGEVLLSRGDFSPLAGSVSFVRTATLELWRTIDGGGDLKDEIEIAWSVVP